MQDKKPKEVKALSQMTLVVLLGSLTALDPLSLDMYLPAFKDISRSFGTSISMVELSVTTFFFGMALGQLFYGPITDRFGRKIPLLVGMFVYFISTIACAFAPSIELFILYRLFQSLGGCAGMVITRAIARDLFDTKQTAIFFSNMAMIMSLGPILAPIVGTGIDHFFGWRAIFYILAAFNFVCFINIWFFLPETNHDRHTSLRLSKTLHSFWTLMKDRTFMSYLLPDTAIRAGLFAYIAGSSFVFIHAFGFSQTQYSLVFGLNGLGFVLSSQLNKRLLNIMPVQRILSVSIVFAAFASGVVLIGGLYADVALMLIAPLFIFITTLSFIGPNSMALAMESQGRQAGTAGAFYGSMQWILASISSAFVSHFHDASAIPMSATIFACGMISLIGYFIFKRRVL